MKRIPFAALLAACGLTLSIHRLDAETYLGARELGDPVQAAGARSLAMGATGVARAGHAAVFRMNPSLLAEGDRPEASLTAGPSFLTEKVVEDPVETRFRSNSALQVNELTLALPLKPGRVWAGLSAAPGFDLHYNAELNIYDSTGTLEAVSRVEDQGAIWSVTPAVAVAFSEAFSVGLSYDFLFGSERMKALQVDYSTASGFSADLRETADYSGGALRAGLRWKATEKFTLGFSFQPSWRLTRDYDFSNATAPASARSGSDKWDMPAQWSLGFSYRVEGERDTELMAEVRQTDWSSVRINGKKVNRIAGTKPIEEDASRIGLFGVAPPAPRSYSDVTELHAGVEHGITPQWAIRYGFYVVPFFADRTVESTFFTFGAGYDPNETWSWSAAAEFGKRDYKGENLFYPATQRADETFRRILLTGRMRW